MHEEYALEDITVEVRGFFYKIPYYVLLEELAISNHLLFTLEVEPDVPHLRDLLVHLKNSPLHTFIKGIIALKPDEYYSYRYVKFNDHDDDRDAMTKYVNQFNDDTLTSLKRELAFFAGCQYKTLQTQKTGI